MIEKNASLTFRLQGFAPLLQVFDMPAALIFYRDILGFEVIQSSGEGDDVDWVHLRLNDIELMLNTAYEKSWRPAKPDSSRINAHRDTGLYFGCRDLDAAFTYFVEKGIQLEGPSITGYGWRAINFFDPDGYHLWFHSPVD